MNDQRFQVERDDVAGAQSIATHALLELDIVAIALIDPTDFCIAEVNDAFARLVDRPRSALSGLSIDHVIASPDAPRTLAAFRALASGEEGRLTTECQLVSGGGESGWCALTATSIRASDGSSEYIALVLQEIGSKGALQIALHQSEERYRSLLNNIDQGYCVLEVLYAENGLPFDYRFLEVNPTFERHTGLVDAVGHTARELVPDLEQSWIDAYSGVALTGTPQRFELGSEAMGRWFDVDAVKVGDPDARTVALLFADITERKRTEHLLRSSERALQESERQHQLLANAMPQVVWVADREGTVRYFNDRIGSFAGASRSESGEWIWERSHHPEDVLPARTAWRSAVESGTPYSNEHRIMMADETYRWHLSRAFPVLSEMGGVERWYGTATDVHDLKLVEHELERRRREFETLVEHSPDIVARFDRDLRFRYINSAVESVAGIPATNFIGRTIAELGMPESIISVWERHCREVIATGSPQHYEFAFDGVQGRRHFRTRLLPEFAPDGTLETLISVSYDITDRVLAEQDRQSLLDALAHDLKSPLAAVKLLAQVMQRQAARGSVPDAGSIAERGASFEGLAVRMTDMVEELMDQARLASGLPAELEREPTNLVALVRQCVDEIEPTAPDHQIMIETSNEPLEGEWDPRRLRRVFENIVGNAVKYSPEGGQIEIHLDVSGNDAIVEVRDPGIGIPMGSIDRIFEFRSRGENVGSISGTGIGLAGAKWIIELHGGTIRVESTEGSGSTFTIRLPLASPEIESASIN